METEAFVWGWSVRYGGTEHAGKLEEKILKKISNNQRQKRAECIEDWS